MLRAWGLTVGRRIGLCQCEGGDRRACFQWGKGILFLKPKSFGPLLCVCVSFQLHMLTQRPLRLDWLAAQHEGLPWGLLDLEAAVPKG